jgi:hypothetical protein
MNRSHFVMDETLTKLVKVKNQPDATKYAVLLPQHVSGTDMHAHHQEYN